VYEPSIGAEPWGERAVGKAAAGKLAAAFFENLPDARYEKLRHYVSPDIAVVESRTTGTSAGMPYDVHLVDVLTLRDGRIAAKRSYRKVRS
jgi:ketosteroid isomerase-like protein